MRGLKQVNEQKSCVSKSELLLKRQTKEKSRRKQCVQLLLAVFVKGYDFTKKTDYKEFYNFNRKTP